jgi:hypothetical protein
MLLCPVFWKGELFCWVTNCLHQYDIGGITPGSFCPSARDAFDGPVESVRPPTFEDVRALPHPRRKQNCPWRRSACQAIG